MITLRPAVVTASTTASWRSLPVVHRRSEPGQHEQRVVDADADPDQAGHRRRPVGHVDDVGQQHDQAAGGDAEAEQRDHERQAGGDDRAERDQQHDRGAEEPEPLGARRRLRGVDRVAAELDLEPVAAVPLGGVDQLLAVLLRDVPAGRPSAAAWSTPILPFSRDADRGAPDDVVDLLRLREERVDPLLRARAPGAGRVLPDDVDLLAGVAAEALLGQLARRPWTPSRACCSRRCTRRRAQLPTPMITTAATIQASTMRPRRRISEVGESSEMTGHLGGALLWSKRNLCSARL